MKKIIYGNIISIIVFILLPWFYLENSELGERYFSSSQFIFLAMIVSLVMVILNIRNSIKSKGSERVASIIFIIPPAFILLYFILGYIAFSRYSILG